MLKYSNQMRPLILPEYGRNIQNMVDHCVTIENPEERQACANTIIRAMKVLFPCSGDQMEHERKLWDHLLIMSDFNLDVELPFGYPDLKDLDIGPDPVPLARPSDFPLRHYGLLINQLAAKAAEMAPGEERDELVAMLANQMKKTMLAYNKDGVEDERIFADLAILTHGAIRLDLQPIILHDYRQAAQPSKRKKKKK